LTKEQKSKLPQELQQVIERFHHDPILLSKLKNVMRIATQHIAQKAMQQSTFCDTFQPPNKLPERLLEYFGLSEREMKAAMAKIGFILHSQYLSTYYQTFCIVYLIGLEFNDPALRKMAILMIDIRLWNGFKKTFWPKYCDPDIARYVINYMIKNHHTFKKPGTPFKFLDEFSIPAVDQKYSQSIPNHLDHEREGLRKLIEANKSRLRQVIDSLREHYYKAAAEGKKEIISGMYTNQYQEGDLVEKRESFSSTIERLVDKIQKNAMMKRNILLQPATKALFQEKFKLSENSLRLFEKWLEDDDNQEEIKYFFELIFTSFKPKDESDVCQFDVEVLANRITGAKKDKELLKAKEILDHMVMSIVGPKYNTMASSSIARAKNIAAFAIIAYAKVLLCKKI